MKKMDKEIEAEVIALAQSIVEVIEGQPFAKAMVALGHVAGSAIGVQSEDERDAKRMCKQFQPMVRSQALIVRRVLSKPKFNN